MSLNPRYNTKHNTPRFKKRMSEYDKMHKDTPFGRNFVFWNHNPSKQELTNYRDNYERIFPKSKGVGI